MRQYRTFPHFWGELAVHFRRCIHQRHRNHGDIINRGHHVVSPKALGEPIKVDSNMDSTGVLRADWQDTAWLSPEMDGRWCIGYPHPWSFNGWFTWDFGYAPGSLEIPALENPSWSSWLEVNLPFNFAGVKFGGSSPKEKGEMGPILQMAHRSLLKLGGDPNHFLTLMMGWSSKNGKRWKWWKL